MINIPYNFNGAVNYQPYSEIVNRIQTFPNHQNIGKDSSGFYDMYMVTMGNPDKPVMMITASVHGVEWQTTQYVLGAMEQLRDNTYPDSNLRKQLLDNFQLVFMPVLNPWGLDNVPDIYAQFDITHYRNSNNVDINRDFDDLTQQETINVANQMDNFKPFAHIDCHMFQPEYGLANGRDLIVGIENSSLYHLRNDLVNTMRDFTGRQVESWSVTSSQGKVRDYTTNLNNPDTPYTFSVLAELERPANVGSNFVQKISDSNIHSYGNAYLYSFFTIAMDYYFGTNSYGGMVNRIETPTKVVEVERDNEGIAISVRETFNDSGKVIKSTINRDYYGTVESIDKEVV